MTTPLKDWRLSAQRSAEAVASEIGVTPAMWSRWETGKRKIPAERVLDIESLTGVSRHDLRPDIFGPRPVSEQAA
jgi:DNA-binding transcriptional regulator YdaS (Cro superfamily)